MKAYFFIVLLFPVFAIANPQIRVSKIYKIGQLQEAPLFVQTTEIQADGPNSFVSNAKIEDPSGKTIMTEKVVVKNDEVISQFVEQLQSKESWELVVREKQAIFRTFKIFDGGRREEVSVKNQKVDSFINGPLMENFVQKHWIKLTAGEVVRTAFSVLEIGRTVDFKLEKIKESERFGKKVIVVKMKPANFFISALVDPMFLEFDFTSKKLAYFKGRTPLMQLKSGEWKPLDAEIIYE